MKNILLLCLLSLPALADENDNSVKWCGRIVETRPAKSCAVKVCKAALLCDFNCAEKNEDSPSNFKKCRDKCWEDAIPKMEACG